MGYMNEEARRPTANGESSSSHGALNPIRHSVNDRLQASITNDIRSLRDLAGNSLPYVGIDLSIEETLRRVKEQYEATEQKLKAINTSPYAEYNRFITEKALKAQNRLRNLKNVKKQLDKYQPPTNRHKNHHQLMVAVLEKAIELHKPETTPSFEDWVSLEKEETGKELTQYQQIYQELLAARESQSAWLKLLHDSITKAQQC